MKPKLIIACSETDSNLFYTTGFLAPDEFVFLEAGGKRIVFINDMEFSRAQAEATVDEIINTSSRPKQYATMLEWIVSEKKISEVVVPENFAIKYAEDLRKLGVEIEVKSGEYFSQREVKSQAEINNIKATQKVNDRAMTAAIEILHKSEIREDGKLEYGGKILTSEFMKEIIGIEFLKGGCRSEMDIVASGRQSAQPHNSGSGPLFARQPIVIDLFPRSIKSKYYADMTRTVVRGKASEEIRKIYDVVLKVQKASLKNVRAGIKIDSLEKEARKIFDAAGYKTELESKVSQGFIHNLGHGVGLDIHESPMVNRWNNHTLKQGSIITIEPGLYYPGIGGVRIEDMVLVKEDGCENLTKSPKLLEIK